MADSIKRPESPGNEQGSASNSVAKEREKETSVRIHQSSVSLSVQQSFGKKINLTLERNHVQTQTINCYGLGEAI